MEIAKSYADKFEQWGIDEAFLDVSDRAHNFYEAEALAKRLKQVIKEKTNLTASIGVGPNKLVAKVASDFHKPDGLTVVKDEEVETFLAPLPVRKLLWVGRKTEAKLKPLGIETIGDLARFDPAVLNEMFGVMGVQMHLMARGIDNSEVQQRTGVKSISHETTFEEDTDDSKTIFAALDALSDDVAEETTEQRLFFKTVTVKVRYENFETHTYAKSLPFQTNRAQDLRKTARELFNAHVKPGRKVRLLGVRASSFVSGEKQKTLV